MHISSFMNKQNDPKKTRSLFELKELDYYDEISDDKKELLRSVIDYLSEQSFNNILHIYNDFEFPINRIAYVQCLNEEGTRILNPIELSRDEDDDYMKPTIVISEEEFHKKYNMYRRVGSQDYTSISISRVKYSSESDQLEIYYTKDGHVFINSITATALAYKDINEIGEQIAFICQYRESAIEKNNNHYRRIMKKNYRNGR